MKKKCEEKKGERKKEKKRIRIQEAKEKKIVMINTLIIGYN